MGERLTPEGRMTWDVEKHVMPKTRGKFKGGTNAGSAKSTRSNRFSRLVPVNPLERVMVLTGSGKVSWQWRARESGKK